MYDIKWETGSTGLRSPMCDGMRLAEPWSWIPFAERCNVLEATVERLSEALDVIAGWDEGAFGDFGGGDVEWWQDYIRAIVGRIQQTAREALVTAPATEEE